MPEKRRSAVAGRCRVGISGWTYKPWRGVFYPGDLARRKELAFASRQFNSIEINGTFYSLQRSQSFRTWFDETPDDFIFSVKAGRFITHTKRLRDVAVPLANFFASGLLALRHKLGPVLWQLPPSFRHDRAVLERFFQLLPRTTGEASRLARRHDDKLPGRAVLKAGDERPLRHALEVRHESFEDESFIELLREHRIALVVADTAGKWPLMEDITADFLYLRLHGSRRMYEGSYTGPALDEWARKIRSWARGGNPRGARRIGSPASPAKGGREVFAYFDNDVKARAPFDARALGRRLGLPGPDAED